MQALVLTGLVPVGSFLCGGDHRGVGEEEQGQGLQWLLTAYLGPPLFIQFHCHES